MKRRIVPHPRGRLLLELHGFGGPTPAPIPGPGSTAPQPPSRPSAPGPQPGPAPPGFTPTGPPATSPAPSGPGSGSINLIPDPVARAAQAAADAVAGGIGTAVQQSARGLIGPGEVLLGVVLIVVGVLLATGQGGRVAAGVRRAGLFAATKGLVK